MRETRLSIEGVNMSKAQMIHALENVIVPHIILHANFKN